MNGSRTSPAIGLILRAEQVAIFLTGVALWLANGGSALLLIPALLVPDLSMVGYLRSPRIGSITYNAVHHLVLALALLGLGWWLSVGWLILAGAAVLSHVGMDRALGYGLKLPTDFRDTHLGRIGRD
jgi:hypothetical protein